jgi:hypothetical protein
MATIGDNGDGNVKKRTKNTVRRMLRLLKRGAIFPLGGDGMYVNPPKAHIIQIEEGD